MGGWIALLLFVVVPISIPVVIGARRAIIAWSVMRHFQPVEAVVLSSATRLLIVDNSNDPEAQIVAVHFPEVRFRYSVAGVEYEPGEYAHPAAQGAGVRGGEQEVARIVARFPAGSKIRAWYDPANPRVAYAYLDPPWRGLWTIGKTLLIAAAVIVGVIAVAVLLQRR